MGMKIELGVRTLIGRAASADLMLPDAAVSREHALIEKRGHGWTLSDLGSRHGTYLNGQRLEKTRALLRNDRVQIGQTLFLFDSEYDIQNADFTNLSVYFAAPHDETMELSPEAAQKANAAVGAKEGAQLDFVVQLSDLFTATRVPFGDALRSTCSRIADLFSTDGALLLLWDSAAGKLRPSVALSSQEGKFLADSTLIDRAVQSRKALLVCDRPRIEPHPAPDAPTPPAARSVLCLPLESEGTLIGVLYLQRDELDAYSLLDLRNAKAVARLLAIFVELRQESEALNLKMRFSAADSKATGLIRGRSVAMGEVFEMIARIAPTPATVLVTGETGTGKEMIAREIHRLSLAGQSGAPFVSVNCSAIPETLFESLVFGHEKGAFTGAVRLQQGLIEQANGGTLFLDEIGELSLALQPKLLRFLQERVFARVGGLHLIRANVRLICATNRDLKDEIRLGRFREDLYHRISVFPIHLRPLRERPEDIAPLAEHLALHHAKSLGREIVGISDEAMRLLERQTWSGNIRELSNTIERGVLFSDGKILLPRHFTSLGFALATDLTPLPATTQSVRMCSLSDIEKSHIEQILRVAKGSQAKASEILGIHRNTLRKKIQDYGLGEPEESADS
jgi:transcriptional regulator with GAF, ATPase, and Fis domain